MSAVLETREPSARYLPSAQPVLVRQFELLATAPGGVARLRNLIVSLAVRGVLSQREPADATLASDVTSDGDAPYELPQGWRWQRLGELQPEFQNGAASRGDAGGQPTTVLRLADIRNRRVSLAATRTVPIRREDIEKYLLRDGDILITRVNGSADIVGQFNLVEGEPRAIYCDHFIRLRVNRQVLDPHYLALFASCDMVRMRIGDLFISTAGQKTVNQGHIASLPIAIPPMREQARIVTRVDELMRLCDALEAKDRLEAEQHARLLGALLGTLTDSSTPEQLAANWQRVADHFDLLLDRPEAVDALEQTILQLAVRGLLVAQDQRDEPANALLRRIREHKARLVNAGEIRAGKPVDEIAADELPFNLPRTWTWARFGDITINRDGERVPVSSSDREQRTKVYDYYGASGVIDKIDGYLFDKTLLLIGEDGANLVNRSTPIAFLAHGKYWVNNHAHVIDTMDAGLMRYLELFINAISLEPYVTGTAQPKMNQAKLNSIVVALPPLVEQSRIVARVTELRRLCADLRQRLTASQTTQSHLAEALVDTVGA